MSITDAADMHPAESVRLDISDFSVFLKLNVASYRLFSIPIRSKAKVCLFRSKEKAFQIKY
jgi:hypothetical protein